MANLKRLEDLEEEPDDAAEMQAAQERFEAQQQAAAPEPEPKPEPEPEPEPDFFPDLQLDEDEKEAEAPEPEEFEDTAEGEEAFHELDDLGKMPIGQRLIVVIAIIVAIGVILYILNYWFHFI